MSPLMWVLLAIGVLGLLGLIKLVKFGKKSDSVSMFLLLVGGGLFVLGITGVVPQLNTLDTSGTTSDSDSQTLTISPGGSVQSISTFNVLVREKNSGTYDTIEGSFKIYAKDANPSDSNTNPMQYVDVANGKGKDTNATLKTNTEYRVVFDGSRAGGVAYDVDWGKIQFNKGYNADQSVYTFSSDDYGPSLNGVALFSTISDMCDETSNTTNSKACLNGQASSNATRGDVELGCDDTVTGGSTAGCGGDEGVLYDESIGDGTYDTFLTISFTGGNTEIHKPALCFVWDQSNPPSGNEYTAITASRDSGTDLGIPSSILNYWKNEDCVALGDMVTAGTSATYKFTWTVDESNLDANADYTIVLDDLGENNGKDLLLNTKGTKDVFTFSGSQA